MRIQAGVGTLTKHDSPNATFVVFVPERQVIHQPGEQASFKHAEQKSHCRNSSKTLRAAEHDGHGAPAEHEKSKPAAWAELLEQDVAGDLEDGVGNQEYHERNDELVIGHVGTALHVIASGRVEDLGVADVGAIEEA